MKVTITKAAKPTYWYAKHIGETFEVDQLPEDQAPLAYSVIQERAWLYGAIEKDDCVITE